MADPMPSDEQSPAEIRAILKSGMWDGAWAKATILRLLDGTLLPQVSVEVWTRGEGEELSPEQIPAEVADVVWITDTWHVVVQLDD